MKGAITDYIDVAQVLLYAFWIFFALLIIYLHRESKREGYPLDSDDGRKIRMVGWPDMPPPKEYTLPHGQGTRLAPRPEPQSYDLKAEKIYGFPGSPMQPTGNPMVDGVGPAAWAIRPDVPDLTHDGAPKIVPLRVATDHGLEERDPDPRGKPVYGYDGKQGGTVVDVWVDRSEPQIRYLEVEVGERRVMLPINLARIADNGSVRAASVRGEQFADAPTLANPDQITFQEEDRVSAYFASGHLYATPERAEPFL